MRIRTVKPEFFKHEELYDAEQETGFPLRVAFEGLWCAADREGRFQWRPRTLKTDILPHDDLDFSRVLDALERCAFVISYEVDGCRYGFIPTFLEHQVINQREKQSTLPAPPDDVQVYARARIGTHIPDGIRQQVFERDGHKCLSCGATDDLTIDHVIPRCSGGSHDIDNLRTLCRPCNSKRPVYGPELAKDIGQWYARAGICEHVHALAEGKGRGREGEQGPTTTTTARARFREQLTAEGQDAFDGLIKTTAQPEALVGECTMILAGERQIKPKPTPEGLSLALCDLRTNNQRPTARSLRTYTADAMRQLTEGINTSRGGDTNAWDKAIADAKAREEANAH